MRPIADTELKMPKNTVTSIDMIAVDARILNYPRFRLSIANNNKKTKLDFHADQGV
jgi:hypothetical protein